MEKLLAECQWSIARLTTLLLEAKNDIRRTYLQGKLDARREVVSEIGLIAKE